MKCQVYNVPKANAPFEELHKDIASYEKLALSLRQKHAEYLSQLESNIRTLEQKGAWQ